MSNLYSICCKYYLWYCMSKKLWPIWYRKLPFKMGHYFLNILYLNTACWSKIYRYMYEFIQCIPLQNSPFQANFFGKFLHSYFWHFPVLFATNKLTAKKRHTCKSKLLKDCYFAIKRVLTKQFGLIICGAPCTPPLSLY